MLKIEKIDNRKTLANKRALKNVQEIMRAQFPGLDKREISELPESIFGRRSFGFKYSLYVARESELMISGFLTYSYYARYNFYYLDRMATAPQLIRRGIGRELYIFLRKKAKKKRAVGIFFECLNDDLAQAGDQKSQAQNASRLKFYERFGARPIINNKYDAKIRASDNSTLLVFDPLDRPPALSQDLARRIVRKIMQKIYSDYCPPNFIKMVVNSFVDDPVVLRPPCYLTSEKDG
jgi:GNAT superfamily N-acetyltransferase